MSLLPYLRRSHRRAPQATRYGAALTAVFAVLIHMFAVLHGATASPALAPLEEAFPALCHSVDGDVGDAEPKHEDRNRPCENCIFPSGVTAGLPPSGAAVSRLRFAAQADLDGRTADRITRQISHAPQNPRAPPIFV